MDFFDEKKKNIVKSKSNNQIMIAAVEKIKKTKNFST